MSRNKRYSSSNSYSKKLAQAIHPQVCITTQCISLKTLQRGVIVCLSCSNTSQLSLVPPYNTHSVAWQRLWPHISQVQPLIHKLLIIITRSQQVSTLTLVGHPIGTALNPWSKWKEISTLEVPCTTVLADFVQFLQNSVKILIDCGLSSLILARAQLMVIPMQLTWCTLITWTTISMAWWYQEIQVETWFELQAIRYSKRREMEMTLPMRMAIQPAAHKEELTSSMSSPILNHQLWRISGDH